VRRFGSTTVVFTRVTENLDIRGPYNQPHIERTDVEVAGCRARPVSSTEDTTDIGTVTEQLWKLTCPPVEDAINAKPRDEITVDGARYSIIGAPRPHTDLQGRPHHVTLTVRKDGS